LSACYPIQLSKNRHPPKGPRFSPNPLVRVKRNVSRRLPRMNPFRLTRTRLPCYVWWIEKIEQPEEPRILPAARHAVNFAPGMSVTDPHHRLFPTRRPPLQRSAPRTIYNSSGTFAIPAIRAQVVVHAGVTWSFRDQIPFRDARQRTPPHPYSTTFGVATVRARNPRKASTSDHIHEEGR